jgi:hypothetical protein
MSTEGPSAALSLLSSEIQLSDTPEFREGYYYTIITIIIIIYPSGFCLSVLPNYVLLAKFVDKEVS